MPNRSHAEQRANRPVQGRFRRIDVGGYVESRGSAFLAATTIIVGQSWLANSLSLRPAWVLPGLSAVLLLVSVVIYDSERDEPSLAMRWVARGVVGILAISNAALLVLLVHGVFVKSMLDPIGLLTAGLVLWLVNLAVFALAYWEIDAGGPEDRASSRTTLPDLVFPQQQADQQGLAPEGWTPAFGDYLYCALTAATAFSPTDVMPYSKTAKLLMGLESTISFAIVGMLVARAINVAKG